MAESLEMGAGEQSAPNSTDNNVGSADAPGAGERSTPLMQRPDWVPEKFFKDGVIDYKGMASSYSELEKKQSQGSSNESKGSTVQGEAGKEPAGSGDSKTESKGEPIAIPGVAADRVAHFSNELREGGTLSEGSYAELAKYGYPKAVVDAFIRGQQADAEVATRVEQARIADTQINEIKASVGGDAELGKMLGWAKANWSPADQKVYNDAVSSGDVAKVKMAVQGLKAAYVEEHGEQPQYLSGRKPADLGGVEPYLNAEEVTADMAKREYKESESFRQKVAKRLAASNVFGNSRDVTKVQRS